LVGTPAGLRRESRFCWVGGRNACRSGRRGRAGVALREFPGSAPTCVAHRRCTCERCGWSSASLGTALARGPHRRGIGAAHSNELEPSLLATYRPSRRCLLLARRTLARYVVAADSAKRVGFLEGHPRIAECPTHCSTHNLRCLSLTVHGAGPPANYLLHSTLLDTFGLGPAAAIAWDSHARGIQTRLACRASDRCQ